MLKLFKQRFFSLPELNTFYSSLVAKQQDIILMLPGQQQFITAINKRWGVVGMMLNVICCENQRDQLIASHQSCACGNVELHRRGLSALLMLLDESCGGCQWVEKLQTQPNKTQGICLVVGLQDQIRLYFVDICSKLQQFKRLK